MSPATLRNYLSDLRQFLVWFERTEGAAPFAPAALTTRTITRYHAHVQKQLKLKAATVNRSLVSRSAT